MAYYQPLVRDLAPGRLIVQPENRGTAAGLLYPLLRIADLAGDVPVAVFPSDHFVDDDIAFVSAVAVAVDGVRSRPELVALLGIEPDTPETEYGWIEADSRPLTVDGALVFPIRRFWEKPSADLAVTLLRQSCLWNSFVMVGRVGSFPGSHRGGRPRADEGVRAAAPGDRYRPRARRRRARLRERLPTINFSERVLVPSASRLGVVRVKGVERSDLGDVDRLLAFIHRTGWRPTGSIT